MVEHVSAPLHPTLGAQTIEYIIEYSEAKLVIVGKLDEWDKQKVGIAQNIPQVSFPSLMWQKDYK
jgi:long-subunit acyl-CoA synthetase (AMP-forming)